MQRRYEQLAAWLTVGSPPTPLWLGGLAFPRALLSACVRARSRVAPEAPVPPAAEKGAGGRGRRGAADTEKGSSEAPKPDLCTARIRATFTRSDSLEVRARGPHVRAVRQADSGSVCGMCGTGRRLLLVYAMGSRDVYRWQLPSLATLVFVQDALH